MFTPERIAVTLFYGAITALTLALAWRSRSAGLLATMSLLAICWGINTIVFYVAGPRIEPYIQPIVGVLIMLLIMDAAIRYWSYAAWTVVALFMGSFLVDVTAFVSGHEGGWLYFAARNLLYVAQLLLIGGVALFDVARHGLADRNRGFGLIRLGGRTNRSRIQGP